MFLSIDFQHERHYSWKHHLAAWLPRRTRQYDSDYPYGRPDPPTTCQHLHPAADNIKTLDHN